jgi:hypothetical protein
MRCFVLGFAGFFVAAVVTMLVMAQYADYRARASLSEVMVAAAPLRARIVEEMLKRQPMPAAHQPIAGTDFSKVGADGTIVFRSAKHGQIIVLEPSIKDNAVSWKCIGSPPKDVPAQCR